jgi:hypothetical protein
MDVARARSDSVSRPADRANNPVRVVAFNTAEHWAEEVSQDVALEIQRRVDLAGDELLSSIEAFIEIARRPVTPAIATTQQVLLRATHWVPFEDGRTHI